MTWALHADVESDLLRAQHVTSWIYENIEYERSPNVIKDPFVTVSDRIGDCADMSGVLLYTLTNENIDGATIILMYLLDYIDDITGNYMSHAVVQLHGYWFDAARSKTGYLIEDYPLRYRITKEIEFDAILFGE